MKKHRRRRGYRREAINWTMPMLAKLRRMWGTGEHSMLEIAVAISPRGHPLSRSAVAGMIRRNGMIRAPLGPRKPKAALPQAEQAGELPSAPSAPELLITLNRWRIKNRVRRVRALPANGEPCILLDLGQGCKWAVGLDRDHQHLFCNKKRAGDGPYCFEHTVRSGGGIRGRPAESYRFAR
jgi:hypothetical protein